MASGYDVHKSAVGAAHDDLIPSLAMSVLQLLHASKMTMLLTFSINTCLSSNHSTLGRQINLKLYMSWTKISGPICFSMKFSSSNFSLWMDLLMLSLWHVKLHMNLGTIPWKAETLLPGSSTVLRVWNFFLLELFCKHLKGDGAQGLNINHNTREHWSWSKRIASGCRGQQHLQSLSISFLTDSVGISTVQCQGFQRPFTVMWHTFGTL